MKLQIAIAWDGDIHIWLGHDMPPAVNIVDLELERGDGMYVIPADRAGPLRELLGTGEVVGQSGARDTRRLERILAMAERLADEIRAEVDGDLDDDDQPKPPGM
ncbi:hypothetical protein [Devosia sp. 1566]|uniref:hypothetical protein n=1 Tax=Devosia sp. 1566 TaxID=2499144 RepID=UPI000FD90A95|nr:hypothetical protein [Devosia sp. 1566]